MEDAAKKLNQEIDRLKATSLSSAADQLKQLSASSAIAEFQKLREISLSDRMRKHIEDMENVKHITLPSIPQTRLNRMLKMPNAEETNEFQSAVVLLRSLADSIRQWREKLPENMQPAVMALLNGGVQVDVDSLAQESFHGIRIEGRFQRALHYICSSIDCSIVVLRSTCAAARTSS